MHNRIAPEKLDNEHIQKLGRDFFAKDDTIHCCLAFFRGNLDSQRRVARKLTDYRLGTSVHDKWINLAQLYAELPDNKCPLAKRLLRLFEDSFECGNIPVSRTRRTRYRFGSTYAEVEYPAAKVSVSLLNVVARYRHAHGLPVVQSGEPLVQKVTVKIS